MARPRAAPAPVSRHDVCFCTGSVGSAVIKKERRKTDNPREGWEDGTPPPHRDFKERGVMR